MAVDYNPDLQGKLAKSNLTLADIALNDNIPSLANIRSVNGDDNALRWLNVQFDRLNEYAEQGLRLIELYKEQYDLIPDILRQVKGRNYRFLLFLDDLSFEEFEIEYKYLKAVIEGGLETKPDNVLIYATSNRRHLIKETWNDRDDVETDNGMHRSDTMQEKLSLVNRFGVTISYSRPSRNEFNDIVLGLAKKHPEIGLTEQELLAEANKWELSHGGVSGRTAQQVMNYLSGKA